MNLLDLAVKVTCKDEASGKISGIASGIVGTMGKAAGIVSAVMGSAAVAGATAIAKSALDAYASYEQLVGGVDTLFKESSATIQAYAAEAYKTAGVSANTYMEQATNFSASLIQSLGGDTAKAAEYANLAIQDMSDNANKMGTSIESIQDTYQSLMRGNYAMLDNLKLGYGGTKSELERLVKDAEKLTGEALDPAKFSDVITAIHAVQENLGITGTTALEAASTIEGSVNTMKAAWSNWLTGLGRTDADMVKLTDDLVDSIITAAENIVPRVGEIVTTLGEVVADRAPEIARMLGEGLIDVLPDELSRAFRSALQLWDMGGSIGEKVRLVASYVGNLLGEGLGKSFGDAADVVTEKIDEIRRYFEDLWTELSENQTLRDLADAMAGIATRVGDIAGKAAGFIESLVPPPEAVVSGLEAIADVLEWIDDNGDTIETTIVGIGAAWLTFQVVTTIASGLSALKVALDGATISTALFNMVLAANPIVLVITAVVGLTAALVYFFTQTEEGKQKWNEFTSFLSGAFETAKSIIMGLIDQITQKWEEFTTFVGGIPERIKGFFQGLPAWFSQLFEQVKQGIQQKFEEAIQFIGSIPGRIQSALGNLGNLLWDAGSSVIQGFWNGLQEKWNSVTSWFSDITSSIPNLKGPIPVDLKLLTPNGQAIMESLYNGLLSGWPQVEGLLSGMTREMATMDLAYGTSAAALPGGTTNVYMIDGIVVNGTRDGDFAEQLIDLLNEWKGLART